MTHLNPLVVRTTIQAMTTMGQAMRLLYGFAPYEDLLATQELRTSLYEVSYRYLRRVLDGEDSTIEMLVDYLDYQDTPPLSSSKVRLKGGRLIS